MDCENSSLPVIGGEIVSQGRQLAGNHKRTSECMTHLAIMKRQPKAEKLVQALTDQILASMK